MLLGNILIELSGSTLKRFSNYVYCEKAELSTYQSQASPIEVRWVRRAHHYSKKAMKGEGPGGAKEKNMQKSYGNPISMFAFGRTLQWKREQIEKIKNRANSCSFDAYRITCPICHSYDIRPYMKVHNFDYLLCSKCNHLFYQQQLGAESIKEIYNKDSAYLDMYVDESKFLERMKYISEPRVRFISEHIFQNDPEKISSVEWLDIGSGGGQTLVAAKNRGFKVRGIEAGSKGQFISRKYEIPVDQLYIDAENIGSYIRDATIISLLDVIEHFIDPKDLVKAIAGSMKEDARLIISVPRHPSYSLFSMLSKPDATSRYTLVPDHIHIFSDESMKNLLEQCGLSAEYVWYFGQDFFEMLNTLLYLGDSNQELGDFPSSYLDSINEIQKAIDEQGLSDSMLLIVKKISR